MASYRLPAPTSMGREREGDGQQDRHMAVCFWSLLGVGVPFPAELGGLLEGLEGFGRFGEAIAQGKGTPTSPTRATPAGKSHHKATAMAQGHPPAAAMASYRRSRLRFARPQTLQTLQTLQKSAQLRREKVPQQAQHAPLPHAKATTRPQQWLKGTPRPQQWLLIGVKPSNLPTPPKVRPTPMQKVPQQAPRPHAKATTRPQAWEANGHMSVLLSVSLSLSTVPPPIRGVGGTWALAHSIYAPYTLGPNYVFVCVCFSLLNCIYTEMFDQPMEKKGFVSLEVSTQT